MNLLDRLFFVEGSIKGRIQYNVRKPINDLLNENIRFPKFVLIDEEGNNLGVKTKREALELAEEKELDVYIVNPNPASPTGKLMNYSKFDYDNKKKKKEIQKNQNTSKLKEIRFTPVIDKNDLVTKIKQAKKFLEEGNKVKVSVRLVRRMQSKVELGISVLNSFVTALGDQIIVEAPVKEEGKMITTTIGPKGR
jgi:translation initiation factor IF-3